MAGQVSDGRRIIRVMSPLSFEEIERGRLEMERGWELRQENILPLECARNEGRFYGLVLKGKQPFTGLQRLGILLIGLEMILFVVFLSLIALWSLELELSLKSILNAVSNLPANAVLGLILAAALGARFCWVALKGPPRNRAD